MELKFPKLQSFMIKPSKDAKDKKAINFSNAHVFKGNIIASNGKITLFFNLKEYLKYTMKIEDEDDIQECMGKINHLCEELEGSSLPREFFNTFSKYVKIMEIDNEKVSIDQNGFKSEYFLEEKFEEERMIDFLNNMKANWEHQRSDQGQMGLSGKIVSEITSAIGNEMANDTIVFDRTLDGIVRFCLIEKDFIFGITLFDLESESSITKFGEANDFFESL